MAIYRLLQNSAFGPEDITDMHQAYEKALVLIGIDRNDRLTETIAKTIIEVAQEGQKDSDLICTSALTRLGIMPKAD